jgi:hypothetical protein
VTVTPDGMLIDVKLWVPGERVMLPVGANAPSRPVLNTYLHWPAWHDAVASEVVGHAVQLAPQCSGSDCVL